MVQPRLQLISAHMDIVSMQPHTTLGCGIMVSIPVIHVLLLIY